MSDVTYWEYSITGGAILYRLTGRTQVDVWNDTEEKWVPSENGYGRIKGFSDTGCDEITKEEALAVTGGVA